MLPPLPTPILRKKSHAWERIQNTSNKWGRIGPEAPKMTSNGFSENDNWNQDAPKATFWGKVRNFDRPGHHWGLVWVIFRLFLGQFGSHFGIKNRKNGMSKDDWIEPGSQTPLWDALGSILRSFWVDFGHRFWTKKQLKTYEQNCT